MDLDKKWILDSKDGETLAQIVQISGCPTPGNIQGQIGQVSEEPGLVQDVPAKRRGVNQRPLKVCSNPKHSMILWKWSTWQRTFITQYSVNLLFAFPFSSAGNRAGADCARTGSTILLECQAHFFRKSKDDHSHHWMWKKWFNCILGYITKM